MIVYGISYLGIIEPMPFTMADPNVSFTCKRATVFGATPATAKTSFWLMKASLRSIGAVGKFLNTNL